MEPQKDFFINKLLRAAKDAVVHHWGHDSLGFIDVGANIGYFTFLAASNNISVLAVEAWDQNMFLIDQTIKSNSPSFNNVVQAQRAASQYLQKGATSGVRGCIKATSVANIGNGKMEQATSKRHQFSHDSTCIDKPRFETLDNIISTAANGSWQNRSIVIMKIDIEGFETHALLGASEFLGNPVVKPCIILVEHWAGLSKYGDIRICEILMKSGYKLFRECCNDFGDEGRCLVHPAIRNPSDCVKKIGSQGGFYGPKGVTVRADPVEYVATWAPSASKGQQRQECQATTKQVDEWLASGLTCRTVRPSGWYKM
eukprot:gnl/MRDRNA2_/MRDRNA2_38475_c0_seq1.p1 gnl/MRDRNA2_/MRDRNA2_38475_c0~~gnl/MRDRNA2_/MRDRNA2_38475_c0_seq1.p1  ORF type:complete len:363 (+),score=58.65 gnl/MRDRNA2_/MRDRNA2_38475_c0_seq1:152-1090(+)